MMNAAAVEEPWRVLLPLIVLMDHADPAVDQLPEKF
jgi:hypothetical protein